MKNLQKVLATVFLVVVVALNIAAILPATDVVARPNPFIISTYTFSFEEAGCWICTPAGSCNCPGW